MTKDKENKVVNKINTWYNIIIFIVVLGTGIGNFMVSEYRHDQHDVENQERKQEIAKIDERVKKTEQINYELIIKQLESIQEVNKILADKIEKTDERIDKVLEILVSK